MVFLKKRGTLKATQLNPITAMILSATVRPMAARALNGDGGLARVIATLLAVFSSRSRLIIVAFNRSTATAACGGFAAERRRAGDIDR